MTPVRGRERAYGRVVWCGVLAGGARADVYVIVMSKYSDVRVRLSMASSTEAEVRGGSKRDDVGWRSEEAHGGAAQ